MIEDPVLLQTLTLTVFAVGYFKIVNIPVIDGLNPVAPLGSALKSTSRLSVVAVPVTVAVTALEHAPEPTVSDAIESVPLPSSSVHVRTTPAVPVMVAIALVM